MRAAFSNTMRQYKQQDKQKHYLRQKFYLILKALSNNVKIPPDKTTKKVEMFLPRK